MSRALDRINAPAPPPAPPAGFAPVWRVQPGRSSATLWTAISYDKQPVTMRRSMPAQIAGVRGSRPVALKMAAALPPTARAACDAQFVAVAVAPQLTPAFPPLATSLKPEIAGRTPLARTLTAARGPLHSVARLDALLPSRRHPAKPRFDLGLPENSSDFLQSVPPHAGPMPLEHAIEERMVAPATADAQAPPMAAALPSVRTRIPAPLLAPASARALGPRASAAALSTRAHTSDAKPYPPPRTCLPVFQLEELGGGVAPALPVDVPPPAMERFAAVALEPAGARAPHPTPAEAWSMAQPSTFLPALALRPGGPAFAERAEHFRPLEAELVEVCVRASAALAAMPVSVPELALPALPVGVAWQLAPRELGGWRTDKPLEPLAPARLRAAAEPVWKPAATALPGFVLGAAPDENLGAASTWMPQVAAVAAMAPHVATMPARRAIMSASPLRPQMEVPRFALSAVSEADPTLRLQPPALVAGIRVAEIELRRPAPPLRAFFPAPRPVQTALQATVTAPALALEGPLPLAMPLRLPVAKPTVSVAPIVGGFLGCFAPAFEIKLAVEVVASEAPAAEPEKELDYAEVFKMAEAQAQRRHRARPVVIDAFRAIAASLVAGVLLYFGAAEIRQARHVVSRGGAESADNAPVSVAQRGGAAVARGSGVIAGLRQAVAARAAAEFTDTFHGGMQSWGGTAKGLASGWSRSAQGFVYPGQLALFHPSLSFTDYRLEFLGEIENKSMDWAVRAKDEKNYYAMKFAVRQPGLRPLIAMVHYSVVDGKPGRRVEIPLDVMVHNHTPYHVVVTVRGNRVVTAIEGEEVDAFDDNSISRGGVGFFADAGERARLYWVKLSHNDDFLGRVCAYMSGEGSASVAELWPPAESSHAPGSGPGGNPDEPALAAAALGLCRRNRPQGNDSQKNRRHPKWNS